MSRPQLTGAKRATSKALIWPLRVVIYALAVFVSFWLVMPAIGGMIGMLVASLFAAAAIAAETLMTARLSGAGLERTAAQRILTIDKILSPQGESLSDRHQQAPGRQLEEAEVVDAEVISPGEDDDRPQLW